MKNFTYDYIFYNIIMNYFKDFTYENNVNYSKLEKIDNVYVINNKEIKNNRSLINDIVYYNDYEIINVKERSKQKIVGIINMSSKTKFNQNGKNYYLFNPINKNYSKFYVSSKNKSTNKIFCLIDFLDWPINSLYPYGNLIEVIGNVGNLESEYKSLLYLNNIFSKNLKFDKKKIENDQYIINNLKKHDYEIFTIDPKNSKDLDDGFHYIDNLNYKELGIHISNPSKLLGNEIDKIIDKVSTIYLNENLNMIPKIYSENLCSLIENTRKYCVSLIIKISNENEIINYEFKESVVFIKKNYDYDNFDKKYKKNNNLKELIEFTKKVFNLEDIDSHLLVEKWMIYFNKNIIEYFKSNFLLDNLIIRSHKKNIFEDKINDLKLKEYLEIKNKNKAIYEIYDENKCITHSEMNDDLYTHFTSPLRRSVDFLLNNYFNVKKSIYEKEKLKDKIIYLNDYEKRIKKFYRMKNRFDFLYHNEKEEIITDGYIIKIGEFKLKIYLNELNLEEEYSLFNKKTEKIANIKYEKKDEIFTKITYDFDNINFEYSLHQKVSCKLFIFLKEDNFYDKIKISILET